MRNELGYKINFIFVELQVRWENTGKVKIQKIEQKYC